VLTAAALGGSFSGLVTLTRAGATARIPDQLSLSDRDAAADLSRASHRDRAVQVARLRGPRATILP